MKPEKVINTLYSLAIYIEKESKEFNSKSFEKLKKYHSFLFSYDDPKIQILNKEFLKIKQIDYQYQVYLMNLERFLGQSTKEYDFLVRTGDNEKQKTINFSIICMVDSVRSAHNIGAFFRNAECFGVPEIILSGLSPTPDNKQVIKTAMGCDKKVTWSYTKYPVDTIKKLRDKGHTIWSIETTKGAQSINSVLEVPKNIVLVFGHEQFGVSLELLKLSHKTISIELFGSKNSLNVSVSQAIVLNHLTKIYSKLT